MLFSLGCRRGILGRQYGKDHFDYAAFRSRADYFPGAFEQSLLVTAQIEARFKILLVLEAFRKVLIYSLSSSKELSGVPTSEDQRTLGSTPGGRLPAPSP